MSNPITKEHFIACMKVMQAADDMAADINRIVREYGRGDFIDGYAYSDSDCQIKLLETLGMVLDDKDHWISWWVYETDFGKREPKVWLEDGTEVLIWTAEDLYDFITNEKN